MQNMVWDARFLILSSDVSSAGFCHWGLLISEATVATSWRDFRILFLIFFRSVPLDCTLLTSVSFHPLCVLFICLFVSSVSDAAFNLSLHHLLSCELIHLPRSSYPNSCPHFFQFKQFFFRKYIPIKPRLFPCRALPCATKWQPADPCRATQRHGRVSLHCDELGQWRDEIVTSNRPTPSYK